MQNYGGKSCFNANIHIVKCSEKRVLTEEIIEGNVNTNNSWFHVMSIVQPILIQKMKLFDLLFLYFNALTAYTAPILA